MILGQIEKYCWNFSLHYVEMIVKLNKGVIERISMGTALITPWYIHPHHKDFYNLKNKMTSSFQEKKMTTQDIP